MEFWGAEIKVGESVKVDPTEFEACIHLSRVTLGEAKKEKPNELVVVYLKVGEQKFVLGTSPRRKLLKFLRNWLWRRSLNYPTSSKNVGVHLCGYKAYYSVDDSEEHEFIDIDEDIPLKAKNATLEKTNGKKTEMRELHTPRRKVERLPIVKPRVLSPVGSVAKSATRVSTSIMVGNNITRQSAMVGDIFAVC
ncbi:hypothetical protein ACSQ67_001719 [Phaseolus vulgaris]